MTKLGNNRGTEVFIDILWKHSMHLSAVSKSGFCDGTLMILYESLSTTSETFCEDSSSVLSHLAIIIILCDELLGHLSQHGTDDVIPTV